MNQPGVRIDEKCLFPSPRMMNEDGESDVPYIPAQSNNGCIKRHNEAKIIKKQYFYFGFLVWPYDVKMSIN